MNTSIMNSIAVSITIPSPTSLFAFFNTSSPQIVGPYAAIGDFVIWNVTYSIPEGTTSGLTTVIKLPYTVGLLSIVNVSLVSVPSNIAVAGFNVVPSNTNADPHNDTATITFTSVVNQPDQIVSDADKFTARIVSWVAYSTLNTAGTKISATSQTSFYNGASTISQAQQASSITVVAPDLKWTVTWSNTTGQAGDIVSCKIVIEHTAASSQAAYSLLVAARIAPYYNLQLSSITSNQTAVLTPPSNMIGWSGIVRIAVLPLNTSVAIAFSTQLDISVQAGSTITNQLSLGYTSSSSGGSNLTLASSGSLAITPIPTSSLALLSPATGQVASGDYLSLQLIITLPKSITSLPTGVVKMPYITGLITLNDASMQPVGSNMQLADVLITTSDTNKDGFNDTFAVSFSSIVNKPGIAGGNSLIFNFTAFLSPVSINTVGKRLNITSQLTYYDGTKNTTETMRYSTVAIILPSLSWTVQCNATSGQAGDVLGCRALIQHDVTSTATAYDLAVKLQLAPYINLVPGSVLVSSQDAALSGSSVMVGWENVLYLSYLPLGSTLQFNYSMAIDVGVRAASKLPTTLMANYSSSYGVGGRALYL